jgi:hypothetical protein
LSLSIPALNLNSPSRILCSLITLSNIARLVYEYILKKCVTLPTLRVKGPYSHPIAVAESAWRMKNTGVERHAIIENA